MNMAKTDRMVINNQPYQGKGIRICERHNEKKDESDRNPDIEGTQLHECPLLALRDNLREGAGYHA